MARRRRSRYGTPGTPRPRESDISEAPMSRECTSEMHDPDPLFLPAHVGYCAPRVSCGGTGGDLSAGTSVRSVVAWDMASSPATRMRAAPATSP